MRLRAAETITTKVIDENDGRCAEPYVAVVPCKLEVGGKLDFDTSLVPDGRREMSLELEDAAGNVTTVYGPRTHTFDNRPPVMDAAPEVQGDAVVGQPLTCAEPAINGQDPKLAYRWSRTAVDGSARQAIGGATARTYTPTGADEGRKLLCELTATDLGGSAARESSLTSGPFADGGVVKPAPPASRADAPGQPAAGPSPAPASITVLGAAASGPSGWALDAFFARGRAATTTASYGSKVEVAGRVKDAGGTPVAGAVIEVLHRQGDRERRLGWATTATDGGWTLRVPARYGNARLVVRAHQQGGALRAATDLALRVRSGISLAVTPRRVRPKGLIRFRGKVLGGRIPAKGKVVELRARSRGTKRWILFKTVRTNRAGVFRTSYRLRRGFRNVSYEFQALTREESGRPFVLGTSGIRGVRVS